MDTQGLDLKEVFTQLNREVLEPARVAFHNNSVGATATLLLCAIGTFAHLSMPASQDGDTGQDYKNWVRNYIPSVKHGPITPEDLWASRCGLVHACSHEANVRRGVQPRTVRYTLEGHEPVRVQCAEESDIVQIPLPIFIEEVTNGLEACLIDVFRQEDRIKALHRRMSKMFYLVSTGR